MNVEAIFAEALAQPTPAERAAYLDQACGQDRALRERVETLLRSHEAAGSFLGKPAIERAAEQVAGPAPGDGTLPAEDSEEETLDFLARSERPDSLGRLGHYEILEVIGRGGMGIVLRAFDEKLQRVVAIKVMSPMLAATSPPRKRFLREARSAAQVRHEHVVDIHAVEEQPVPYLVMEYVSGETLQQKLDRVGPLEVREVLRLGQQIARGLAAAHERGLIHRDIKPSNILIEQGVEERVKITDFGLARAVADASLTQSGVIAGTPMYMAPEQTVGDTIDHRADLFSLGSVLYTMTSGRPPFRATTSMATLKRVAEDTPRPIRDIIPEVPQWLCDIIAKLHAKKPDERFQSAKEVGDLLRQRLTHLEQPSLAPRTSSSAAADSLVGRRRWLVAATLLLVLLGGLSVTEATGVTNLRATVIRVFIPEGTLVVETNDPGVKVTIEGDGGLLITGAGLEEIRLRPGSYRVHADRDGKPLPLEKELVSISKGDREIVKVKLEREPTPIPAAVAARSEKGAFVRLGDNGVAEQRFDTLAAALQAADDGDIVEVRGNGPFITDPIIVTSARVTLRGAPGFRPVIRMSPKGAQTYEPLLQSDQSLVVEGLEFQRFGQKNWDGGRPMISQVRGSGPSLHLANCRFRWDSNTYQLAVDASTSVCGFRNCEFLGPWDSQAIGASDMRPTRLVRMENCVLLCDRATGMAYFGSDYKHELQLVHSTLVSFRSPHHLSIVGGSPDGTAERPLRVEASANLYDAVSVLWFGEESAWLKTHKPMTAAEAGQMIPKLLTWREQESCYTPGANATAFWSFRHPPGSNVLAGPHRLAGGKVEVTEGKVRYEGGDLRAKFADAPEKVSPADFRLRPDSAGYRSGKDGRDLGADIDFVGPGAAYERWKKTPEYQQWLKATGQWMPKAEANAFVLLSPDTVERKFDSLAEAIGRASSGDTIEVRGDGPFVTDPIPLIHQALTIRAGNGVRPVIRLSPKGARGNEPLLATNASLLLEGLELQRLRQKPNQPWPLPSLVSTNGHLRAANCRFIVTGAPHQLCVGSGGSDVQLRNCEFICLNSNSLLSWTAIQRHLVLDNCLHLGGLNAIHYDGFPPAGYDMVITRNTVVSPSGSIGIRYMSPIPDNAPAMKVSIKATRSVFALNTGAMLGFQQTSESLARSKRLELREQTAFLPGLLKWRDRGNVYSTGGASINWSGNHSPGKPTDWKKYWSDTEGDLSEGTVKFQGGNLAERATTEAEKITPADFRLRPDSAGFKAGKDGKDLGADIDLVGPGPAYERWKNTPEYQRWLDDTKQMATGAFVVLGAKGVEVGRHSTLAAAVQGASDGDTIEVRGNGPFVVDPIMVKKRALTLRAGAGRAPVIRLSELGAQTYDALLETDAALVLEGLEFQRLGQKKWNGGKQSPCTVRATGKSLHVANCTFHADGAESYLWQIVITAPTSNLRNSLFLTPSEVSIDGWGKSLVVDNCIHLGRLALGWGNDACAELKLNRNTLVAKTSQAINLIAQANKPADTAKPRTLEVTGNLFDVSYVVHLGLDNAKAFDAGKLQSGFVSHFRWKGRDNLYQVQTHFVFSTLRDVPQPPYGPTNLEQWRVFSKSLEPGSVQGKVRYQRGDLMTRLVAAPAKVTPEDFRLRPDSAGYQAGPDKKDLGADVDLVGPGPAYERWKKTPQYQQWLEDSGQIKQ